MLALSCSASWDNKPITLNDPDFKPTEPISLAFKLPCLQIRYRQPGTAPLIRLTPSSTRC